MELLYVVSHCYCEGGERSLELCVGQVHYCADGGGNRLYDALDEADRTR